MVTIINLSKLTIKFHRRSHSSFLIINPYKILLQFKERKPKMMDVRSHLQDLFQVFDRIDQQIIKEIQVMISRSKIFLISIVGSKQMQEQSSHELLAFRVPQVETSSTKRQKMIIGLIDASGSMGSYWKEMAKFWNQTIAPTAEFLITFSHIAKLEENTILSDDLRKHGGGMTNIYAAFQKLEERLMNVPQEASITIVFISDGQDTTNGEEKLRQKLKTLRGGMGRDITLLCLGIQSGFPTKIAMDIRQLYHTGDEKIPAIYLIEYASEKAFFNKFQTMSNCFKISNSVKCLNAKGLIKEYPWEQEAIPELKEGKWIMVHRSVKQLDLIYNDVIQKSFPTMPIEVLQLDELVDLFRGWVQKIQLLSMDNKRMKQTSQIASYAVKLIREYTVTYEKNHKLYILTQRPLGLKESFKERASSLAVKNIGSRIQWFVEQLNIIAKGVGIGQLNEYEAAKRIGIGTITGKYHQKALALKGITAKDFEKIKEEFTETFSKVKLSEKPSSQEGSLFTLQNQKEVFQEPDFLDGLKMCVTQFDLVQSFPVVGFSLKVKRYDGSMINPWKVRVLQLAKTHRSIDSVYLANHDNKYELSVGEGRVEEINAVLPLFDEDDVEMSELFNTKLFKLAVSFMVVQNIDTFHDEAYLALLASTFVFLIKEPKSEWRDNLIRLIYTSIKVTYWQTPEFRDFIKLCVDNPYVLFTSKQKEDHTDITKVMLLVFFIGKEKLVSKEQLDHLVDLVMVHYVEKTFVENQFKLARVANLSIHAEGNQSILKEQGFKPNQQKLQKNIVKGSDDLKKIVDEKASSIMDNKIDIEFSEKIFLHNDEEKRVTFNHIRAFYQKSKGQALNPFDFIYYFGHALKGKDEAVYKSPVSRNIDDVKKQVFKKIDKSLGASQGKKMKQFKKMIEEKYIGNFKRTHFGIVPLTPAHFKDVCQSMKIDPKKLHYNPTSGMISNACMSSQCAYYMQPMSPAEFSDHMRLWRKTMPVRFHSTVANNIKLSTESIYDLLINSKMVILNKHKKSKEEVLQYIENIKKSLTQ